LISGNESKGAICVATFSRAEDLDRCITNIVRARKSRKIPLIVVHQKGFESVAEVLNKWESEIQILVHSETQGRTPLENINLNSLLGREIAFTWLQADWCLGVEDDVQISSDAIDFVLEMYLRHKKDPFFRGVNLGSKLKFNETQNNLYSKIRFGIHGQASMITRKTWRHFDPTKLRERSKASGLDAMMEHYVKTGFMCTPRNSRYLDNGWNGTHSSSDPNHEHYSSIRDSYYEGVTPEPGRFAISRVSSPWRADSKLFSIYAVLPVLLSNKVRHARHKVREKIVNIRLPKGL
jgi:hypothetical protein